MSYREKITWDGGELVVSRPASPVDVRVESGALKLEKINIHEPALQPSNYARAEGTPLPLLEGPGVRVDLSKRTREPMNFWHRNLECDEVIFCHKGSITWETELGTMTLNSGEMFVIPRGVAHRAIPPPGGAGENIILELKVRGAVTRLV